MLDCCEWRVPPYLPAANVEIALQKHDWFFRLGSEFEGKGTTGEGARLSQIAEKCINAIFAGSPGARESADNRLDAENREEVVFVSGHEFTRAVIRPTERIGLQPLSAFPVPASVSPQARKDCFSRGAKARKGLGLLAR